MFRHLRMSHRFIVAIAGPAVLVMGLAFYVVSSIWSVRVQMSRVGDLTASAVSLSALVHELQRERGLSATFIASRGGQMRSELPSSVSQATRSAPPPKMPYDAFGKVRQQPLIQRSQSFITIHKT